MGVQINEDRFGVITQTLTIPSLGAAASTLVAFTLPGLNVGDFVNVSIVPGVANVSADNAYVSAKDTLTVQFENPTAAPIVPGATPVVIWWFRPEHIYTSVPV